MEQASPLLRIALGFVLGLAVFGPLAWYLQRSLTRPPGPPDERDNGPPGSGPPPAPE